MNKAEVELAEAKKERIDALNTLKTETQTLLQWIERKTKQYEFARTMEEVHKFDEEPDGFELEHLDVF